MLDANVTKSYGACQSDRVILTTAPNGKNYFNYYQQYEIGERLGDVAGDRLIDDFLSDEILPSIDPELADIAVRIIDEGHWNQYSHEIEECFWHLLGIKKPRFGRQAIEIILAALFINEDGSLFQAKPLGKYKGLTAKYLAPKGSGDRPFTPPITPRIAARIAHQAGIAPPKDGSFWQWLIDHPEIPLILTEGVKKSLAIMSQGGHAITLPALSLFGNSCGVDKDGRIKPELVPYIKGRAIDIAFDQDEKLKTRKETYERTLRLARALEIEGCEVRIWYWKPEWGKGIDDVIANNAGLFQSIVDHALSVDLYEKHFKKDVSNFWKDQNKQKWRKHQSLTNISTLINHPSLAGIKLFKPGIGMGIGSGMGTGKTHETVRQAQHINGLLTPGYRNSLGSQFCQKINDWDGNAVMKMIKDISHVDIIDDIMIHFCVDSFPKLAELVNDCEIDLVEYFSSKYLFIDEVNSVIDHCLNSGTLAGKRIQCLELFKLALKHCKGFVYADANLSDWAVNILSYWSGKPQEIVKNTHSNINAKLSFLEGSIDDEKLKKHDNYGFLLEMRSKLDNGEPIAVCSDSQIFIESCQEYLELYCKDAKILRIDGKTSSTKKAQQFLKNPDLWLTQNPGYTVLYTTSAESGLDISIKGYFAGHWGFYFGIIGINSFAQLLGRIRDQLVDKHVWARTFSIVTDDNCISFNAEALAHYERQALMLEANLLSDYAEVASNIQMIFQNSYQPESALALQIRAMKNYERSNLRECLLETLTNCGYQITHQTIARIDQVKAAKTGFQAAKESVKDQNISDIANAHNRYIGQPTARLSMDSNYEDQCALKKAQWIDRLPGIFDQNDMDQDMLRLIIYDQPKLISGLEKLILANDPSGMAAIFGKQRFNKIIEQNKAIPWLNRSSYLESRLLSAINIQSLIDALSTGEKLSKDHSIIQGIYSKLKGTISIDGQKARGSHYLKRSIPNCPAKLASILLHKVGFPHSLKDGIIKPDMKAIAAIAPYKDALQSAILNRFETMKNRILDKTVPVTTVTAGAVTPNSPQPHTGQEIQPSSGTMNLYKSDDPKKPSNVLNFKPMPNNQIKESPKNHFIVGDDVSYIAWNGVECCGKIAAIKSDIGMAILDRGEMLDLEKLSLIIKPDKPRIMFQDW